MGWATFWAILSQTHLVTLLATEPPKIAQLQKLQSILTFFIIFRLKTVFISFLFCLFFKDARAPGSEPGIFSINIVSHFSLLYCCA
jgi:hypothetical protein